MKPNPLFEADYYLQVAERLLHDDCIPEFEEILEDVLNGEVTLKEVHRVFVDLIDAVREDIGSARDELKKVTPDNIIIHTGIGGA